MTIAPGTSLIWTLIDVALCHFSVLNSIYYLVESTLLMSINLIMGIMSALFYGYVTTILRFLVADTDIIYQLGFQRRMGSGHLHADRCYRVSLFVDQNCESTG